MPTRLSSVVLLPLILAALLLSAGCRPIGYAPRLVGVWVGVPQTAAQRSARSPAAMADEEAAAPEAGDVSADANAGGADPLGSTTLESLEVRVTLDLAASGGARMWVGDDEQGALSGTWRVVSSELDRSVIEIVAKREGGPGEEPTEEKRRFAVQLMEDDNAFTLCEEGADRFFGKLYFRRADAE